MVQARYAAFQWLLALLENNLQVSECARVRSEIHCHLQANFFPHPCDVTLARIIDDLWMYRWVLALFVGVIKCIQPCAVICHLL